MDEEQSVSIPKIKTDMLDAKTGLKLANAEEDKDPFGSVKKFVSMVENNSFLVRIGI